MSGQVLAIATFCAFWVTPFARHHQHDLAKPPLIEPVEADPSSQYDTEILILPAHIVDFLLQSNMIPPSARLPPLPLTQFMSQFPPAPPLPPPDVSSMLSLLPMLFPPMLPMDSMPVEKPQPRKPKKQRKKCSCPAVERPVCGSDGLTYANECELKCGRKLGRDVVMVRAGECEKDSKSEESEEVVQEPDGLKEVSMEEDYSLESSSSSEEDYPDGLVFDEVPMGAKRNCIGYLCNGV